MQLEIKILDPRIGTDFSLPNYSTDGSAGLDMRACLDDDLQIEAGQTAIVKSGVAIHICDPGYMAVLAPRSGLGIKHRMILANTLGIIDSDYQDEIKIALWNAGPRHYRVEPGERICQLIIVPVLQVKWRQVESFSHTSGRAKGGMGHTGRF